MEPSTLVLGVLWYGAFIVSIVLHEGAHALVAYKLGDPTAFRGGQVTLDPRPHIRREPVGTIIMPILSFIFTNHQFMIGWAHAPYDPHWAERYPRRKALMALAGPMANLLTVIVVGVLMRVGLATGYFVLPEIEEIGFASVVAGTEAVGSYGVATLLSILFGLNLILFVLNMLPLPPLDGSSVVTLFFSQKAARKIEEFRRDRMFSLLGIIVAWRVAGSIFWPAFLWSLSILYA